MKSQRLVAWLFVMFAIASFVGIAAVHHFTKSNARERASLSDAIKAME